MRKRDPFKAQIQKMVPFHFSVDNGLMGKKFTECAKRDSDASALLYKNGNFALSIFHLQQAFEKAVKAEMLIFGYFDIEDLRNYSHRVLDAVEDLKQEISYHLEWEKDESLTEWYEWVRNHKKETLALTYEQISELLFEVQRRGAVWQEQARLLGVGDKHSVREAWAAIFEINLLAILLAYHEESTRYPDMKEPNLTPSCYTSDSAIVQAVLEMRVELEYILGYLDNMYIQGKHDIDKKRS